MTNYEENKRTPKKHSYVITRTCPFWDTQESPCKNAYKIGDDWRIDFDDIEELPEITGWGGEFIIKGKHIEIYDDYRE